MITVPLVIISLIIIKLLLKLGEGWDKSPTCLNGKTAIVTGANTGIGFHIAQDFAKRGARVILACRNITKANKARDKIIEATGNSDVVVKIVDFLSLASVRTFAKEINETEERLDILINNIGASHLKCALTNDLLNLLMQTNHFAPFLLTHLLIGLLQKSAPSRIVNISSASAWLADVNAENLNEFPHTASYSRRVTYSNTKLCNILFTNELARKLEGTGITANSVNPGFTETELRRNLYYISKTIIQLASFFTKTNEGGAQTAIHVAVSKELENISGKYFDNCRIAWLPPMPWTARDENFARKVWSESEEFVKLTPQELIK